MSLARKSRGRAMAAAASCRYLSSRLRSNTAFPRATGKADHTVGKPTIQDRFAVHLPWHTR